MKMAKPTQQDIHAALRLVTLLDEIEQDEIDLDELDESQELYTHIRQLMMQAPGFHRRIIVGMGLVIMNENNNIIDPDADVLDFHPDIKKAKEDAARLEKLWQVVSYMKQDLRFMLDVNEKASETADLDGVRKLIDESYQKLAKHKSEAEVSA